MRTLSAELTAAMDSGAFEPYLMCYYGEDHDDTYSAQPLSFTIRDTYAKITIPKGVSDGAAYSTFRIVRGAIIDGVVHSISTIYYYTNKFSFNGKTITLEGDLLPQNTYNTTAANSTYEQVILDIGTYNRVTIDYEIPANTWKNYQFYPTGRTIVFSDIRKLFTTLAQKYLIFAAENGWDAALHKNKILLFIGSESKAQDYAITDLLFTNCLDGITKRLLWRDENGTIHTQGAASLPMHNLGFLPSTATAPGNSIQARSSASHSSKLPVHLKYQTGDWVNINPLDNGIQEYAGRIEVEEVFDPNQTPSWHHIIRPLQFFSNTEGGAMPSTIEAAAPYTPLVTGNFAGILSASDNNIQAAMETIDDHAHTYAEISAQDADTDITAAELEELSDGSETTLHSHAESGGRGTNPNPLPNPGFRVHQRGVGPFTSATTPANNDDTYLVDGCINLSDGNDIVDVSVVEDTDFVSGKKLRLDVETANKKFGVLFPIQKADIQDIRKSGLASVQFKVKCTGASISNVRAYLLSWSSTADAITSDVINAWGAAGADPTFVANWTAENVGANLAINTVVALKKIENIAVDTASVTNLALLIMIDDTDASAGDFLEIGDIKIESGAVCTEYQNRDLEQDEALCMYRFRGAGGSSTELFGFGVAWGAAGASFFGITLTPPMAATPTISTVGTFQFFDPAAGGYNCNPPTIESARSSKKIVALTANGAAGLTAWRLYSLEARSDTSTRVYLSCEL